jgi:PAS domain S-box-containing protein
LAAVIVYMDEACNLTRSQGVEVMLAEKARLAALGSDVGAALVQIPDLSKALQRCVEAIVEHLDAAFARIWTLAPSHNVLELQASAGLYTHLNGPHARVPVGAYKIGRIAQDRQPHLTNDVAHDPRVSDPDWAAREGMTSFAGYPLIVEEQLVGVLGLFARHTLAQDTITALASVSTSIALGIERKRTEAALVESAKRYRFLAESMPQMVWTATPDGALDYVSCQAAGYFGVPPEALLGSGWLTGVHPEDRESALQRWRHSLESGELYEAEFRLKRGSDGEWRWFLARAHSMSFLDGDQTSAVKIAAWVGTCTDIHEQKQDQAALFKANRELEEFAYVASHDLQEPLRMVNIYTQLLFKSLAIEDPRLTQYASFVHQGVHRMEALLRDLLTFSRNVHTEEIASSTADLSASLNEALAVLDTRIKETHAVITAPALPAARGDTPQLAHVFQNLLSNSLKYRSAANPRIDIRCEPKGNRWIISVRDNGIGFDQKYAERIFGLFKRLHKDEYPGTGLGLAICQRIVERYGGRMWAESAPGEGATFYFSLLPLEDPAASAAEGA